ncbi:hypothetical protein BGZ79_006452, partial [Entomortierella chlamydospora]
SVEIPVLYIVCAMGLRCSVYRHNIATQETLPEPPATINGSMVDSAPAEWWNIDISTLDGRLALMECFDEVKAMCVA